MTLCKQYLIFSTMVVDITGSPTIERTLQGQASQSKSFIERTTSINPSFVSIKGNPFNESTMSSSETDSDSER